eukprot:TRINITY_DN2818_c2_g1_i1.p1 TRINITY_DN2818_c2_g1~~TRINITY_DN2818_c2_g1_i1.p1  ORF type:complete len:369 (-),score=69.87 TRINITY_DN2818_c2_g1_i1:75-1181(-)
MAHIDNAAEAERAFLVSHTAFDAKDFEKARRFVDKSLRLHPTDKARALSQQIKVAMQLHSQTRTQQHNAVQTKENTAHVPQIMYTQDQVDAVNKIKGCRSFYEVLGVEKQADDAEIKKAYRKMALAFHPDKNQAPGAEDAFKLVSLANDVLGTPKKRKNYDLRGGSGVREDGEDHLPTDPNVPDKYQGENLTADIIIELMKETVQLQAKVAAEEAKRKPKPARSTTTPVAATTDFYKDPHRIIYILFQVLPILLIFLTAFMCASTTNIPEVSFKKTNEFPIQQQGTTRDFVYYVSSDWNGSYDLRSLYYIERSIRPLYAEHLRAICDQDKLSFTQSHQKSNIGVPIDMSKIESQIPSCAKHERWIHGK